MTTGGNLLCCRRQDLVNVVRPSNVMSSDAILDAIKAKVESRDRDLPYRGHCRE